MLDSDSSPFILEWIGAAMFEALGFMKFHEVSWSFMKFHEVSWSFMKFHEVSWSFMKFHASWNVSKQKWFASAAGLRTITVIIVMQNLWHANSTWVKEDKMWQDMTRYDKIWQDRGMKGMKVLAKVYLGWNQILSNTSTQGILVSDLIWQNKKQAIDSRLPPLHNAYNI